MALLSTYLCLAFFVFYSTAALAATTRDNDDDSLKLEVSHRAQSMSPGLHFNFPDPAVIQAKDGTWYAFATNSSGKTIPVAEAEDPLGDWDLLDVDAMTEKAWTDGNHTWAPDVRELDDGSYIMYFSGQMPDSHQHCIGVARSDDIIGPYKPDAKPWVCPLKAGGAIDASGFHDEETGHWYVVYKVDGNSAGKPTKCGARVGSPKLKTPLMLQRVESKDGSTKIGEPVQLIDRIRAEDGALVEAPNLTRRKDGMYVLFFSSHCFTDPKYDIKYAYSKDIEGPYTRNDDSQLLKSPDYNLYGPGGMTVARVDGDDFMVFHANCAEGKRCMYATKFGDDESGGDDDASPPSRPHPQNLMALGLAFLPLAWHCRHSL